MSDMCHNTCPFMESMTDFSRELGSIASSLKSAVSIIESHNSDLDLIRTKIEENTGKIQHAEGSISTWKFISITIGAAFFAFFTYVLSVIVALHDYEIKDAQFSEQITAEIQALKEKK